jgi:HD-like signal output (HDOD) protein
MPKHAGTAGLRTEKLGISHTAIGAYVLGLWGLPEPVVITAELHHTLDLVPAHAHNPILYVHAAENILKDP